MLVPTTSAIESDQQPVPLPPSLDKGEGSIDDRGCAALYNLLPFLHVLMNNLRLRSGKYLTPWEVV
jgi:hypothetical protein